MEDPDPSKIAHLDRGLRELCAGPGGADERVDGLIREAGDHQPVAQRPPRPCAGP
jgi:hypothetical protein